MYSKNLQDGVGTSPGATNSWKKKKKIVSYIGGHDKQLIHKPV